MTCHLRKCGIRRYVWILMLQMQIHCMELKRSRYIGKLSRNWLFIILCNSTCLKYYTHCQKADKRTSCNCFGLIKISNWSFPPNQKSQYVKDLFCVLMSLALGSWPCLWSWKINSAEGAMILCWSSTTAMMMQCWKVTNKNSTLCTGFLHAYLGHL